MNDQTADTIKKMVDAFNTHDLDTVYGLLHDDYHEYRNGKLTVESAAAARAADQPTYDAISDFRRETDELIVSGSAAAMRWRFLGTGRNGAFEVSLASFFTVQNAKIVEAWMYLDVAATTSATGLP